MSKSKSANAALVETAMRLRNSGVSPEATFVFVCTRRSSTGMTKYYKVLFLTFEHDDHGHQNVTEPMAKIAGLRMTEKGELVVRGCGCNRAQHVFELFASRMATISKEAQLGDEVGPWREAARNPKPYNYQQA